MKLTRRIFILDGNSGVLLHATVFVEETYPFEGAHCKYVGISIAYNLCLRWILASQTMRELSGAAR